MRISKGLLHVSFLVVILTFIIMAHGAFNTLTSAWSMGKQIYVIGFLVASIIYAGSSVYVIRGKNISKAWAILLLVGPLSYPFLTLVKNKVNGKESPFERIVDVFAGLTVSLLFIVLIGLQLSGHKVYGSPEFVYGPPEEDSGWEKVNGFSGEGIILDGKEPVCIPGVRFVHTETDEFYEALFRASYFTPRSDLYIRKNNEGKVKARLRNTTLDSYLYFFPGKEEEDAYFEVDFVESILNGYHMRAFVVKAEPVAGGDATRWRE